MTKIDEDYEAWEMFPRHRWIFNKLELSLKLGYICGPACVPVPKTGEYIIRPIYNLYGMGVGARKMFLRYPEDDDAMTNHKFIPPGYFWCEWFKGNHYSIDYKWTDEGRGGIHSHWNPTCTTIGQVSSNIQQFSHWEKIENKYYELPNWLDSFYDTEVLNIEYKDDKILEVHLRTGNDVLHEDPIGTEVIPNWLSDDREYIQDLLDDEWEYYKNYDASKAYDASGYIEDPKIGYLKRCKL
jgi:hypothetical protein